VQRLIICLILIMDSRDLPERLPYWISQIRCPKCASKIVALKTAPRCSNDFCEYNSSGFPLVDRQPVLIDFPSSVFNRGIYGSGSGSVLRRDVAGRSISSRLHRFTFGNNPVAAANCSRFLSIIEQNAHMPKVLVVGGATIGSGSECLYADASVEIIGMDVFASKNTVLVADAHKIPFDEKTFDAVWIQAVLEHVLDPAVVVAEIHRILKPSGIVYAETPFMQQVHERAYDFTRFTQSGHRWLFKQFTEVSAGPVSGAGVALLWSIRYFFRSLGTGDKLSRLFPLPFVWLRFFDFLSRGRLKSDAASGVFFLGKWSDDSISPAEMPSYYNDQR
jgi:SAM-dependent methyltransferase